MFRNPTMIYWPQHLHVCITTTQCSNVRLLKTPKTSTLHQVSKQKEKQNCCVLSYWMSLFFPIWFHVKENRKIIVKWKKKTKTKTMVWRHGRWVHFHKIWGQSTWWFPSKWVIRTDGGLMMDARAMAVPRPCSSKNRNYKRLPKTSYRPLSITSGK